MDRRTFIGTGAAAAAAWRKDGTGSGQQDVRLALLAGEPGAQGAGAVTIKITLKDGTVFTNGALPPAYHFEVRDDCIMFHLGILGTRKYVPSSLPGELTPNPDINAYDLGPHSVEIFRNGASFQTVSLPKHLWASRWCFPLRPVTFKHTTKELIADLLLPPYGNPGTPVALPANLTSKFDPQGTASIAKYEPGTGGRADIGFFNEWTVQSILTGRMDDMMVTADACFSLPIFFRDERSGQCQDVVKYFGSTVGADPGQQGLPWIDKGPQQEIVADVAHMIECGAAAYAYNEEPRYLELLQYAANFTFLSGSYYSNYRDSVTGAYFIKDGACIGPVQTRAFAWGFRHVALAETLTRRAESRGPLPSYLKPSSYFKTLIDNHRPWIKTWFMDDPSNQVARLFTTSGKAGFWQENFKGFTLAYMAAQYPEWREIYVWWLGQPIAMTNGKSGWPPALAGTYYVPLGPALDNGAPSLGQITPAMMFKSWGEIYENYATRQMNGTAVDGGGFSKVGYDALKADQYNGMQYAPQTSLDYAPNLLAVLAYAVYLDRRKIVDISSTYPELEQCYATQRQMWVNAKAPLTVRCALAIEPKPIGTLPPQPPAMRG